MPAGRYWKARTRSAPSARRLIEREGLKDRRQQGQQRDAHQRSPTSVPSPPMTSIVIISSERDVSTISGDRKWKIERIEAAGKRGECGADGEGGDLVSRHVDAERRGRGLVGANGLERPAEARSHAAEKEPHQRDDQRENEIIHRERDWRRSKRPIEKDGMPTSPEGPPVTSIRPTVSESTSRPKASVASAR